MHKATLVRGVQQQRRALLHRVARLPDDAWDAACPVPPPPSGVVLADHPVRRVRDVVAHLLVVDEMSAHANLVRAWNGLRRLELPGAWDPDRVAVFARLSATQLVTLLARGGEQLPRLLETVPAAARLPVPVPGPLGRRPLAQLIARRVLHEWLHERDIADATGPAKATPPRPDSPEVASAIADAVLAALPADTLLRCEASQGVVRLDVDVHAEIRGEDTLGLTRTWGVDFARRQYGPRVRRAPDATIKMDAASLALLANGRGDRLGDSPRLAITGDEVLARSFLAALGAPGTAAACVDTVVPVTAAG